MKCDYQSVVRLLMSFFTKRMMLFIFSMSLVLQSSFVKGQVIEIKKTKKSSFSQVLPIHNKNELAGYLFLYKKKGKFEDLFEFVATDMHFKELKRGIYKEKKYEYFESCHVSANIVDSTIVIKNQFLYKKKDNDVSLLIPFTINYGFVGGLIYGAAVSITQTANPMASSGPMLEMIREISLDKKDSTIHEKRLSFKPDFGLSSNFLYTKDSLIKRDYYFNIYPMQEATLVIHNSIGTKGYYSNDTIFLMGNNHLIKWKSNIKGGSAGKKFVSPVIKNFTFFDDFLVINNSAELDNKSFSSYVTFFDKDNGNIRKEFDINRDFHARINQYNEFRFVKNDVQKDRLLILGRSAVYEDIQKCDGIYLNFVNNSLSLDTAKIISWTDLNQYMPKDQKNYFTHERRLNINNVYWSKGKILLVLQEQTGIGYADLITILLDEKFNIVDLNYTDQKSKKLTDICSTPYFNNRSMTINLFRKEVSLELNQLQVNESKITIKKIDRGVDFFYDFALEGINSVVFGGLEKKSGNVLLKEMKL